MQTQNLLSFGKKKTLWQEENTNAHLNKHLKTWQTISTKGYRCLANFKQHTYFL